MSDRIAEEYLQLLAGDEKAELALLACSAAFRLDDNIACEAIELVANSNGSTERLLKRIKGLGCVWRQGDKSWCIAEDIRPYLVYRLYRRVKEPAVLSQLHERLAAHADEKINYQNTQHGMYQAKFEAAVHRLMLPEQSEKGATQLADMWQQNYPGRLADATADSVDYLAREIEHLHAGFPAEVLFLQGMSARTRKDRKAQERYFGNVYRQGHRGRIYALAAFFYARIIREPRIAEEALEKCIEWDDSVKNQVIAYHELGNLLSKSRRRQKDAEAAYRKSLELDQDLYSQSKTWHSLGDLLTDQGHWLEARKAYETSLKLRGDRPDQGQVYHSLGNLLSEQQDYWEEAESAYQKSIDLLVQPIDKGQVYHSRGKLLAKQPSRWHDAEKDFLMSIRLRNNPVYQAYVFHSLGNLLSRQPLRWREAETAFKRSLELRYDPSDKIHVLASWVELLSKFGQNEDYRRAEKYLKDNIRVAKANRMKEIYYQFLADIYEKQGKKDQAIEILETLLNKSQSKHNKRYRATLKTKLSTLRATKQK